jgi:molecular chaperone GrpE
MPPAAASGYHAKSRDGPKRRFVARARSRVSTDSSSLVFPPERFILPPMQREAKGANGERGEGEVLTESTGTEAPTSDGAGSGRAEAAEAPAPVSEGGELKAEVTRLKDALLRTAADFDNFRKRSRREMEDARRGGREDLLRALLPVFDNLERAIQSAQRSSDVKAMTEGLTMVQRQFVDALGREGIQRVATVGQAFDPSVHEAIQQVETADHAPGTVLAEVQPGYTQGERLVRAAMVVVAKAKPGEGGGEKDPAS